jgi:hypothetical protein
MKQSDNLTKFYRAYLAWANDGAPVGNIYNFWPGYGLCYNSRLFDSWGALRNEMIGQFVDAGLDSEIPFNAPSSYARESSGKAHHLNVRRMRWVREHAAIPLSTEV